MGMQISGLKRQAGLLAAGVIVVSTIMAAPAQARHTNNDSRLGQFCERNAGNQRAEVRCCKQFADNNRQENRCINYVKSHPR